MSPSTSPCRSRSSKARQSQDTRAVAEAEDVLGQQVAVTVAHPPVGDAPLEQGRPAVEVRLGERARLVDVLVRARPRAPSGRAGRDPLTARARRRGDPPRRSTARSASPGETRRPCARPRGRGRAPRLVEQRRQTPRVRHAPHLDQVVARVPLLVDDVEHPEVHVGREAPVHLGLAPACARGGPRGDGGRGTPSRPASRACRHDRRSS